MVQARLSLPVRPFGQTKRRDAWWGTPPLNVVRPEPLRGFSPWAGRRGSSSAFAPYLSPSSSPELLGARPHACSGPSPSWWPGWPPSSPALLILWAPAGFRFTCYYSRGAYYKAFWMDPPSCTVG